MSDDGPVTTRHAMRAILAVRTASAPESSTIVGDFATVAEALAAGQELLRRDSNGDARVVVDAVEFERDTSITSPGARSSALLGAAAPGQMLVSDPAADLLSHAPVGIHLTELGTHRFHGMDRPITIHEARGAHLVQAPIRTLNTVADGLPTPPTPLIGRHALLAEIGVTLNDARITTLTGPGGSGKTRLALELASGAANRFRAIHWIELGSLSAADNVLDEMAARLGLLPARADGLIDSVARSLRDGPQLLVLDNAEHLIDTVAGTAGELLRRCPELRVMVTSREALGVEGEAVRAIPPLGLPTTATPDEVAKSDAGGFMLDRLARASGGLALDEPTAALVHRICHRLDGIPLALELAAARRTMLSLEHLADGLDDRFTLLSATRRDAAPRQRTLEASVRWSHELLTDDERVAFRRLAVFSGSFRLTDAIEVIGSDISRSGVLVGRLVECSLVASTDRGVLRLLETVRSFAEDRLDESGETTRARDRHLGWLVNVSADIAPIFDGPEPARAIAMTRRLLPDVRAAIAHAETTGRAAEMWLLLDRLTYFFFYQGNLDEALAWFARADQLDDGTDPSRSASGRVSAALLTTSRGDHDEIDAAIERALSDAVAAHDERAEGRALTLSGAHRTWNDPPAGRETLTRGRSLCRQAGDHAWEAWGDCGSALALTFLGRPLDAMAELLLAEQSATRLDARRLQLDVLARRCICEYQLGRWGAAASTIEAGRAIAAEFAGISVTACFDVVAAWLDTAAGHPSAAAHDMGKAIARYLSEGELQFIPLFLEARSTALIAAGRAAEAVEPLAGLRSHPGVEWSSVYRHWLDHALAVALLESDRRAEARSIATRLVADAQSVGNHLDAARGTIVVARLDEADAEIRSAEHHVHDALTTLIGLDARPAALDALEIIARLDALLGHAQRSAAVADGVSEARAELVDGTAPDLAPLVELVRRTRGERGRPTFGWDSLTPTELVVVSLVADGLTNPEIAKRLVVGRSTIKTHVSSALRKLGLTSRTQLATEQRSRARSGDESTGRPAGSAHD